MSEHSESVVLDVTDYDTWWLEARATMGLPDGSAVIPMGKRSSVIQRDREVAEREAVRLAQAHPGRRFAVFTFVGVVEAKHVATHVTLGGRVVATTMKPVWQERDL